MKRFIYILDWIISLFNPPPLDSMTRTQKVNRVFFITATLVISCILFAMFGTLALFIVERGREMLTNTPELMTGLFLICTGIAVNIACVFVLLQIRNADRKLIP